jgi:phosphoribosylformylglycinamidine cyclo-ligase
MSKYDALGVSAKKTDVHAAIKNLDKGLYPKAFCKIISDVVGGDDAYVNIMHADGAGTKSSLAWLYWMETGDLSVWKGIAQDAIAMNIDDVACTGVKGTFLLSSTIGRNKSKVPGEVVKALIEGLHEVGEKLNNLGIRVINTGGETADLGDLVKTVVVDSTVMLRGKKQEVVDNARIMPGDAIVGISSGNDVVPYEDGYNSGIGSNGLTLARHAVLHKVYAQRYPETFDQYIDQSLVYNGGYMITDPLAETGINVGKALLSPTRFLAHVVYGVLGEFKGLVNGVIHCTGGGQTKILHFIDELEIHKTEFFSVPPIFSLIKEAGKIEWKEMYQVFNMGHRIELYIKPQYVQQVIDFCSSLGVRAKQIGEVKSGKGKSVELHTVHGNFNYRG